MNILCTICSDRLNQAENIFVIKCGHIFHYDCLLQWIERSKTCPQCRNNVTENFMFRLYPTVSNANNSENAATLQSQLDNAQLELRQREAKFQEMDDKIATITADLKRQEDLRISESKKNKWRPRLHIKKQQFVLKKKAEADLQIKVKQLEADLHKSEVARESLRTGMAKLRLIANRSHSSRRTGLKSVQIKKKSTRSVKVKVYALRKRRKIGY